jgi:glycine/D-amino acid oxidase-like deaminating enzyme
VVVLECGRAGCGILASSDAPEQKYVQCSGSAVINNCGTVKMILQLFTGNADSFVSHHGEQGARTYLRLTAEGAAVQRTLAESVLPDAKGDYRQLGMLYIAHRNDEDAMREEFIRLGHLGCQGIQWWDKEKLIKTPGCPEQFYCAIFFPDDAVINSALYAAALLKACTKTGKVLLYENSPRVVSVDTIPAGAEVAVGSARALTTLANGHRITSKHVIVATGGLSTNDLNLSGILRPCWSYLVAMPHPEASPNDHAGPCFSDGTPKFSPNFVTWGFTHDWCWTNGAVRISGEDHYSALKPPRSAERCASLANWTCRAYPHVFRRDQQQAQDERGECRTEEPVALDAYARQYGVYSETPDAVPLVGQVSPHSRVCYLLGCNALGQAVLSYAAMLVPGLLGYRDLTDPEREAMALMSVQRFSLLPAVQGDVA